MTLRTVEVHLTHAYQKLGISSREELPAALREDLAPADGRLSAAGSAGQGH